MDEMDVETQLVDRLEAAMERKMQTLKDNVGLNKKDKVEEKTDLKGIEALKNAIAEKTFHGKLAKPTKDKVAPTKETYAEKIERITKQCDEE